MIAYDAVNEMVHIVERALDSDYMSVRPVLAQPAQHQAADRPASADALQAQVSFKCNH